MKSGDILLHKLSDTLAEIEVTQLGISLKFQLYLSGKVVNSSTRYYSEEEIMKHWRLVNKEEINLYKLNNEVNIC